MTLQKGSSMDAPVVGEKSAGRDSEKTGVEQDSQTLWCQVDRMIDTWLKERQSLILLLCAVDGLREYTPQGTPVFVKVQAFCEIMLDYVSAGHFEIYEKLVQEAENFGDDASELVDAMYPKLRQSTEMALWFNDKYENSDKCADNIDALTRDMSLIAESLSERFELEDRLIADLHARYRELVATSAHDEV